MRNVVNDDPEPPTDNSLAFDATAAAASLAGPIDFAFLAKQTFADRDLEREILRLFVAQARRVVPTLPSLSDRAQADAAHLLKGSARGIGAWHAAAIAEIYEQAPAAERGRAHVDLVATFEAAADAIDRRFADDRG